MKKLICKLFGCTTKVVEQTFRERTFNLILCSRCGARHVIGDIGEYVAYCHYFTSEKIKKEITEGFYTK